MILKPVHLAAALPLLSLFAADFAAADAIRLVSRSSAGVSTPGNGASEPSATSADGRYVLFFSAATDHIAGGTDTNGGNDAFLWDRDASTVTLISHSSASPTTAANGFSFPIAMSGDGRWVAFYSVATNLISGTTDGNADYDTFLWDRDAGTTTLVSHIPASPSTTANGQSLAVAMSADGRYLAFSSLATNLVSGGSDGNGGEDAFVWDRQTDSTTLVSKANGTAATAGNGASTLRGLSSNGRHVAFHSQATNLVTGQTDANGGFDMFYANLDTGTTTLVSHAVGSTTTTATGISLANTPFSCISGNGQFVTFGSSATNLLTGTDTNSAFDAYLWDRNSNTVSLVSHIAASTTTAGNAVSEAWAVSDDGNFVVFDSAASNLIAGGTDVNGVKDTFVLDRVAGTVRLASHASGSTVTAGNGESDVRRVSTDGRFVAFGSFATNLIAAGVDGNSLDDAYRWDGASGTVTLLSHALATPLTAASGSSFPSTMSSNGLHVALRSTATNLAPGTYSGNTQSFLWSVDSTAPSNPGFDSVVPPAGAWTNDNTVTLTWSGAADDANGSGLAGYSLLFDHFASTQPDTIVDLVHLADPHGTTSAALVSGADWYFHLSACDQSGNCSTALPAGPFEIDTQPPGVATALSSSDHVTGEPSNDPGIDLQWTDALDQTLLSGLDGYALQLDNSASWSCDQAKDVEEEVEAATATAPFPSDAGWWFHLCARDNAGNWGAVASLGPFEIDTVPASVLGVGSVAGTPDGLLSEDEATLGGITRLLLFFDDAMADPAGNTAPEDVTNPANYRLYRAGQDGVLSSAGCAGPVGDDLAQAISGVAYSAATETAALSFPGTLALPRDLYRLVVCPTLEDDAGSSIGSFTRRFRITADDRLPNPNFDVDLAGWTITEPQPATLLWSVLDAGAAASSGSAEIVTAAGAAATWRLARCLETPVGPEEGRVRAQIESVTAGAPGVTIQVEYFAGASCAGSSLGSLSSTPIAGDTAGSWSTAGYASAATPATAQSARVSAVVAGGAAASFTVRLDDLFHGVPRELLVDGFESGDTSEWTSDTP